MPKSSPEKKLADPSHTKPVQIHRKKPKNIHSVFARVEGALGLRFGCQLDEWDYPNTVFEAELSDLMEDAYHERASTVGELHVVVNKLAIASARAIFTLPINIPGYRKKAVVGSFDYLTAEREDEDATSILLARAAVGIINKNADNPFFEAKPTSTDPNHIPDLGVTMYLREGNIGTI